MCRLSLRENGAKNERTMTRWLGLGWDVRLRPPHLFTGCEQPESEGGLRAAVLVFPDSDRRSQGRARMKNGPSARRNQCPSVRLLGRDECRQPRVQNDNDFPRQRQGVSGSFLSGHIRWFGGTRRRKVEPRAQVPHSRIPPIPLNAIGGH